VSLVFLVLVNVVNKSIRDIEVKALLPNKLTEGKYNNEP
jgi:hypothetical protein